MHTVSIGRKSSEFNLRHDWNSLLSNDQTFLMSQYSQDYYPQADDLVKFAIRKLNRDCNLIFKVYISNL